MKTLNRYIQLALSVALLAMLSACDQKTAESTPLKAPNGESPAASVMAKPQEAASKEECVHDAPEDECFICNAELREKGRLWCKEHNRYEDRCFICHPELKDEKRMWCKEHFLYEDECHLCHPEIKEKKEASVGDGVDAGRLFCKEHGVYEDECTVCHPELANGGSEKKPGGLQCKEHQVLEQECGICHPELVLEGTTGRALKIRFGSAESTDKAGVQVARPAVGSISDAVQVYAEIKFNQNKLAYVSLPVGGIIYSVHVDVGQEVSEGELLAEVSSIEISKAIGEYLRAVAEDDWKEQSVARERRLRKENISSEKDLQAAIASHVSADSTLLQARQQLRTLGFTAEQIKRLVQEKEDLAVLEVRAPFAGEIVARNAVRGSMVEMGTPLFTVVDRTVMWAMLNIPEKDIMRVRKGLKVEVEVESIESHVFKASLHGFLPRLTNVLGWQQVEQRYPIQMVY